MNGIIEIALVVAIVVVVVRQRDSRDWLKGISPGYQRFALVVLALLMIGQIANISRSTFPFVRWSMYTEPYDGNPIVVAKFQAVRADGSAEWINVTKQFPSLARNFDQTASTVFQLKLNGKLPSPADEILASLVRSVGKKYNDAADGSADNPIVQVRGVLQQIVVSDGRCQTKDIVVQTVDLNSPVLITQFTGTY
jgi:hypothetical protein